MRVAGLLLAAGAGRRFGTPKALVSLHGKLFVDSAAELLRAAGCDPVVVVLGAQAADVREQAVLDGVTVVDNPDWATGMGSSLRTGLHAVGMADAAIVLPVDTPGVTVEALRRLMALAGPNALARATYDGEVGHPVVIGSDHFPGVVASAAGDQGARDYLKANTVRLVECADVADGVDVDRPQDLTRHTGAQAVTMLLVHGGEVAPDAPVARTGGVPLVPEGFAWPLCRECGGAMRFLAHLPLDFGTVAVFLCENDPGMCDGWDAAGGANRALLFTGPLSPAVVPAEGVTLLDAVTALRPHSADERDEESVLGKLGGEPDWWQHDETPACPSCATRMTFTAQLEEGHDHSTAINFGGGGRGYVFHCRPCGEAAFVWQR